MGHWILLSFHDIKRYCPSVQAQTVHEKNNKKILAKIFVHAVVNMGYLSSLFNVTITRFEAYMTQNNQQIIESLIYINLANLMLLSFTNCLL